MKIKGYIYIFLSVICFSIMSLCVKIASGTGFINLYFTKIHLDLQVPIIEVSFFRFFVGLICAFVFLKIKRTKIECVDKWSVRGRAVFNTLAVTFFYITIHLATVTKGNIYNLTYPIFVVLFAPIILDEKFTLKKLFIVIMAMVGAFMIADIQDTGFSIGDLTGILSGFFGGWGISYLRKARLSDDTMIIIFHVMLYGSFINLLLCMHNFVIPNIPELIFVITIALLSLFGQIFLTYGQRYISAVEGSIVSSTRIFIAAILSILLLSEKLTVNVIIGGIIVFAAIILINKAAAKENLG